MDIKQYIESGILEAYALGLGSAQDRQAVECLSKIYPEIREALSEQEQAMEVYATSFSQKPAPKLKQQILNKIASSSQDSTKATNNSDNNNHTTTNNDSLPPSKNGKIGWGLALLAIIGLSITLSMFLSQKTFFKEQLRESDQAKQILQDSVNQLKQNQQQLQANNQQLAIYQSPDVQKIILDAAGTPNSPAPDAKATVHWNNKTNSTHLALGSLPSTSDQDYQLWAIVEGQPVDLGVLPETSDQLIAMKAIESPSAFAITLEPKGGSKSPTLEQMYVIGNV